MNPDMRPNYTYGVDTNDKEAMKKEYKRLKRKHMLVSFLAILGIGILMFFGYDFVMVNMMNKKPLVATKERVDGGYFYQGVGYKILYCDNGDVYKAVIDKEKCSKVNGSTFDEVFYNSFMDYVKKEKIVDSLNLLKIDIINKEYDSDNNYGGSDYIVDMKYNCVDGSDSCFKVLKETNDQKTLKLYVSLNDVNKVADVFTFKNSGKYYDTLVSDYTEKIKQYKIDNGMINEEQLRMFSVKLVDNYGRYKYNGVMYADTYLVGIDYLCLDDGNACVVGENYQQENLYFEEVMLLDDENNVSLMKNPRILSN